MRYLLRRIGFYLAALWASVTINFILPRVMPGDPVTAYMTSLRGQNVTPETMQAIRAAFGVSDDPLWVEYFRYLGNLLRGELGVSISRGFADVSEVLASSLPWTLGLVGIATMISFVLGTLFGTVVAWRRNSLLDTISTPLLTFFSAIPYFWLALGLMYLFGYLWKIFPLGYGYDIIEFIMPDDRGWNPEYLSSVFYHGVLPTLTIVISSIGGWVLGMRNAMITTLSEDYVLMARAKGLDESRVMLTYGARNAVLPNITGLSMALGFVIGGQLLTEIVFNYPGVGFTLISAIRRYDYSLIQGIFLMITITMLVANFISELAYVFLDPRVRHEGS